MKLREMIEKKFEIDNFMSNGSKSQQIEKAFSLQPEMVNFELATGNGKVPRMHAGCGYEEQNAVNNFLYEKMNINLDSDAPADVVEKFEALYKRYLQIK